MSAREPLPAPTESGETSSGSEAETSGGTDSSETGSGGEAGSGSETTSERIDASVPPAASSLVDAAVSAFSDSGDAAQPDAQASGAVPVTVLNNPDVADTDPSFTTDLLELYFMSVRGGSKDIWRSLRASPLDPWGAPQEVTELNLPGQEENPFIAADGLDIWFFTDRDRRLGSIWHAARPSRDDAWGEPEPLTGLTTGEGSSDVAVSVSADRLLFVLNSKLDGSYPYQLYEFTRDGVDGAFSEPRVLGDVNSPGDDYDPDMRQDGLFLAFDSAREGRRQLFWTRRPSIAEPFAEPVAIPELASTTSETAIAVSEDLRYVMFSSNREGTLDIYEAYLEVGLE